MSELLEDRRGQSRGESDGQAGGSPVNLCPPRREGYSESTGLTGVSVTLDFSVSQRGERGKPPGSVSPRPGRWLSNQSLPQDTSLRFASHSSFILKGQE